jgi:hypothetical protein
MSKKLPDVPWETARKTPKPPNGLSWPDTMAWYRENAHEVWRAETSAHPWTWYVLKRWQKNDDQPFARWFCLVDGAASELGDVYVSEVKRYAVRVR